MLFVLLQFLLLFMPATAGSGTWPMPDSLLAFWPLDSRSKTTDLANNMQLSTRTDCQVATWTPGPFGESNTSYTMKPGIVMAGSIGSRLELPLTDSFSLSFYLYTAANYTGGIAAWYNVGIRRFGIGFSKPNNLEIYQWQMKLLSFPILKVNTWNFFAITYDRSNARLNIYDEFGKTVIAPQYVDLTPDHTSTFCIGCPANGDVMSGFRPTDAIACVMVYKAALSPSQIVKLPRQCQLRGGQQALFPRSGGLLGVWPLDTKYQHKDATKNGYDGAVLSQFTYTHGPFGDPETAVTPSPNDSVVLQATNPNLSVAGKSLTLSFFFRRAVGNSQGGILEFLDKNLNTAKPLQIRYVNKTTFEISATAASVAYIETIQPFGAWTFLAVVYDAAETTLTVYSRHGVVLPATYKPQFRNSMVYNNNGIRVGYASRWKQGLLKGDAISCLTVYSEALNFKEIGKVIEACREVLGSAPCGSSRVTATIPSSAPYTAFPKPGQFPYVASVRSETGTNCSATIIDQFWLVTAGMCFLNQKNASYYKVYVGEHDMSVSETFTRVHKIANIFRPPSGIGPSSGDINLIELTEPIDMTNEYVNDACLLVAGDEDQLKLDGAQFVVGWGKNGRKPMETNEWLPRYVPGDILTDYQCRSSWNSFDSKKELCFLSSTTSSKDVSCAGDEGSPLLVQVEADQETGRKERLVQAGTFYYQGCHSNFPGRFVRVSVFADWIASTIACAVPGNVYPETCPQD